MLTPAEWLAVGYGFGSLVTAVAWLVWLHHGPDSHQDRW
jgi:hypothetical protein